MKRLIWLLAAGLVGSVQAQDELFMSLTRSGTPVRDLPTNVSRLNYRDLELENAVTLDEGLSPLPSVMVQKSGTLGSFSTVRLRGSPSSGQQQILIDDLPLMGISNQFLDASQIPVTDIERVEVVRGGSSVLYGPNTMGGVIHVITKRPVGDRPRTRLRVDYGSFMTQVYEGDLSGRIGHADAYVSGGRALSDGFQSNGDADNVHAMGKLGYTFENGLRIAGDASIVDSEVGNPKGTLLPVGQWNGKVERTPQDSTAMTEQDLTRGHGEIFVPLGNNSFQTTFYSQTQNYENRPTDSAAPDFKQHNRFWGADSRLILGKVWTLGASYGWDAQKTFTNAFSTETANNVSNVGAYVQADFSLGALRVLPGLRFDDHSAFGDVWNPRLTLVWAEENWKVSANAAKSFRAPSFLELFYEDGFTYRNPDLQPERAWSYDLGFELSQGPTQRAAITAFYTKMDDRITFTSNPFPAQNTFENFPKAEIAGLELESTHEVLPKLVGRAAYTYTRAQGNSRASSDYIPLRLTPRHMVYYRLLWLANGGWDVANTARYTSKQYQSDGDHGLDLPDFFVWDIRISKRILAAELYLACENILDRRYALTFDNAPVTFATTRNPQPNRTFMLGVTIRFED